MKFDRIDVLIWVIAAFVVGSIGWANYTWEAREQAADEAYRLQVTAQKKAAKDKLLYDLAKRGEYMTGFAMVQK